MTRPSALYADFLQHLQDNPNQSLGRRVEELAAHKTRQSAVICREERLTYGELNSYANRYAAYFSTAGYSRGDVVVLIMENSVSLLAAIIGLSKLGITSALVNTTLSKESLARDINFCDARAVLLDGRFVETVSRARELIRLRSPGEFLVKDPGGEVLHGEMRSIDELLPGEAQNPASTAAITVYEILAYLFTSGSGGHRKTVPLTHSRWLLAGKAIEIFTGLTEQRVQYMCLPLYMSGGFNACFAGMIASGSTLVLAGRFSVSSFWEEISSVAADYFFGVGEMFRYLYNREPSPADKEHTLKTVISNGAAPDLIEPFKARFGVERMIETYNTTENIGMFINAEEIPGMCGSLELAGIRQGELLAYDMVEERIITASGGRPRKPDLHEVGLLLCAIYDYNDFSGYIHDPGEGAAAVMRSVFSPGDKYFNTHDVMRLHERDYLSFVQRLGGVFRWKGRTVSAYRVSDVLKKFFGAIDDAHVFAVSIPGFEGSAGMAVIRLLEGEKLSWGKFNDYLRRRLPPHERPLFIRLSKEEFLDEALKKQYRQEGAHPRTVAQSGSDELYVYDIQQETYLPLTEEIYGQIIRQEFVV